jgi:hypothetical protein
MATTNPTSRLKAGARMRCFVRRYRTVIVAGVGSIALILRLPLVVHLVLLMATEVAIALMTGRRHA